jgi:hypothetical protein
MDNSKKCGILARVAGAPSRGSVLDSDNSKKCPGLAMTRGVMLDGGDN